MATLGSKALGQDALGGQGEATSFPDPEVQRVTQTFIEVIGEPPADQRVTQTFIETIESVPADQRVTQTFIEVIRSESDRPFPRALVISTNG